jgi:ABC-type ATPase involved in cell division
MNIIIADYEVQIDDEDYKWIKELNYCVNRKEIEKHGLYYFFRNIHVDGKRTATKLHREIMGCVYGDRKIVDHINGNTLDNRKCNLRICTQAENKRNQKIRKTNISGLKGVSWHKKTGKWVAQINTGGKHKHLGLFMDIKEAYSAYCEASKKYHGEYGRVK